MNHPSRNGRIVRLPKGVSSLAPKLRTADGGTNLTASLQSNSGQFKPIQTPNFLGAKSSSLAPKLRVWERTYLGQLRCAGRASPLPDAILVACGDQRRWSRPCHATKLPRK